MLRVDDLELGMIVAVREYRGSLRWNQAEPDYDGKPWEVVAISLPFILLNDGCGILSLDTRLWTLQRVSKEYAQTYYGRSKGKLRHRRYLYLPNEERGRPTMGDLKQGRKVVCPRCGSRTKKVMRADERIWKQYCSNCGWEKTDA